MDGGSGVEDYTLDDYQFVILVNSEDSQEILVSVPDGGDRLLMGICESRRRLDIGTKKYSAAS